VTGIPATQFSKPCRAEADASIRTAKHVHGCAHVGYSCSRTQRTILVLMAALVDAQVR
jgi:hypothetical protein